MTDSGYYALDALLPPTRFIVWAKAVLAARAAKGDRPPPDFTHWLNVVERLRAHPPVIEIEMLTADDWVKMYETCFAEQMSK